VTAAIIPARGGSRGVPRKNLQPIGDHLLLTRAIERARGAMSGVSQVYVSTDDPAIAAVARYAGAEVIERPEDLAGPDTTVAEVLRHAVSEIADPGPFLLWEPTAVGVPSEAGRRALRQTPAIVVAPMAKLAWTRTASGGWGLLGEAVNRQGRDAVAYVETGVFAVERGDALLGIIRSAQPNLIKVEPEQAIDVDTPLDLAQARIAERTRETVTLVPIVGHKVGTGHLRRCMTLADQFAPHPVTITPVPETGAEVPEFVWRWLEEGGYRHSRVVASWTDAVILDQLDTDRDLISAWREVAQVIVTLEDRGEGARHADATVNELYDDVAWPHRGTAGPKWAVLPPEFRAMRWGGPESRRVVLTFGGTDPASLTDAAVACLARPLAAMGLELHVVMPPGRETHLEMAGGGEPGVTIHRRPVMAEILAGARLAVTSAGRTVHEAACLGVPVVSIAANRREEEHSRVAGVAHLGPHWCLEWSGAAKAICALAEDPDELLRMSAAERRAVDGRGAARLVRLVEDLLTDW